MSIVDSLGVLLPHLAGLRVTGLEDRGSTVRIHAETMADGAPCPECGVMSRRIHSVYGRLLLDTAIGGREVLIGLRVRRFACRVPECPRRIFAERVDTLTRRYGRRTHGATATLEGVGLALGGRAGARLVGELGLGVGRMTLLRRVRGLPVAPVGALTALGVDDFAFRRGCTYGTVLVDMLTRWVVDVLDARSAESLATWLLDHPGIRVICRDRASCYAEGAARGAPDAIQVADRWHLLHNLAKAVREAVAGHRRELSPPVEPVEPPEPIVVPTPETAEGPRARRTRERYAAIRELRDRGLGIYAIVKRLGLDAKTVHRYADAPNLESLLGGGGRGGRSGPLDPFGAHLHRRCSEGVTATGQLLDEIRAQGYRGGERTLRRYLIAIRGRGEVPPPPPPAPSTRQITTWIMRPAKRLSTADQAELDRLCGLCPDLATIRDLAHGFTDIVRTLGGERLTNWIEEVDHAEVPEIRSFAHGLRGDWAAVMAGLTLAWSSGPVEGAVNRIKMIKRQMFGRAKFDILRQRILLNT